MKHAPHTVLFLALCGCTSPLLGNAGPYVPPGSEQREAEFQSWLRQYRAHSEKAEENLLTDAEREECRVAFEEREKALEERRRAQAAIGPVTDEEREEHARRQGEAREGDICYREAERGRSSSVMVRVPCGRPAHDYREMGAFAGPSIPTIPAQCLQALEEAEKK